MRNSQKLVLLEMEIDLGQALGNIETWDFSPGFVLKLIVKFNQKFNEV